MRDVLDWAIAPVFVGLVGLIPVAYASLNFTHQPSGTTFGFMARFAPFLGAAGCPIVLARDAHGSATTRALLAVAATAVWLGVCQLFVGYLARRRQRWERAHA